MTTETPETRTITLSQTAYNILQRIVAQYGMDAAMSAETMLLALDEVLGERLKQLPAKPNHLNVVK
ncbi:MAG: hypothetical protein ACOH2I_11510 [Pseudomonas sp.]